tara:strand:- start:2103 stop:2900 length:798 start_codon:yes stop_codon:yes gene_type:complete
MKKYVPRSHGDNRMNHEGDTSRARNKYYLRDNPNLASLLYHRFNWMNAFINKDSIGIEVGAGTGVSKEYIKSINFKTTDFADNKWLDHKMIDALNTGFKKESFDFVVSSNMIHHVPYPTKFFEEMSRILKPGGKLIIQEINCSFFMKLLLRVMRHEGFDYTIDVFDKNKVCTDENDLWSANCAIPNLLFDDIEVFKSKFKYFKVEHTSYSEFFLFINSGGVISKTSYIPLASILNKLVRITDSVLIKLSPKTFALQRQIVLAKNK